MKKKLAILLLSLILALCCAVGLAACGESGQTTPGGTEQGGQTTPGGTEQGGQTTPGGTVDLPPTEGLEYVLSDDGESAACIGMGTATATAIVIASEFQGKPVTTIGSDAFKGCTALTSVTIPDSVTSIGGSAFYGCRSLTSVTIGNGVTTIGEEAFYSCTAFEEVHITDLAAWCNISFDSFYSNPLRYGAALYLNGQVITELTIPDSVTTIKSSAFSGYTALTSVTIPDSVTTIGEAAFYDCTTLEEVHITDLAAWCNISFDSSSSNPLSNGAALYLNGQVITELTIPDSVTTIGYHAFYDCDALTSITIPDSVTSIGEGAFSGCPFTSVTIPNSVTTIADEAFRGCDALTIYCEATSKPSGWNSDWNYSNCPVIWDCNNNEVATDGSIYQILDGIRYALKNGTATVVWQPRNMSAITIPASVMYKGTTYSVTTIGEDAFEDCTALTSVTIPNSVTTIGVEAFRDCTALTSITIPDSVTTIGERAFINCTALTSVTIPDSVTSIESSAFEGCTKLTSITIPDSVTTIWYGAFENCTMLTSAAIPNSVTRIENLMFENCTSLAAVSIGNSVTTIGAYAFNLCTKLSTVYYCGTQAEWENISINTLGNDALTSATRYYYSETQPTTSGKYWHYVDGVPTKW